MKPAPVIKVPSNISIRILLVDDNPHFLGAARDLLGLHKTIEVAATATGGREALTKASLLKPDLILLDLNLGTESGFALIPLFKETTPKSKIIVLTIMGEDAYRAAAMQAGADAFVRKVEMGITMIPTILDLAKTMPSTKVQEIDAP